MSRLGRNPFERNRPAPATAPAAVASDPETGDSAPAPALTTAAAESKFTTAAAAVTDAPEALELSSLRDFIIKDIPAAALMLAIKGALRWSDRSSKEPTQH